MTDRNVNDTAGGGDPEVLTFRLGEEVLAIEAAMVQEILDLLPETGVPGADPLVGHLINFRGRVIPLADLRPALGMEPAAATRDSRIVVVAMPFAGGTELIGLRADKVEEVVTLAATNFEEPPTIGMRWPRNHVRALVRRDRDIVVLPDLEQIFSTAAHPAPPFTIH